VTFAPIALFVYNRPEHTRRTLAALRDDPFARQSDLTVFADAAKRPEHEAAVAEVRSLVRAASGFRSVTIIPRDRNLGLAASISDGVGRLCAEHGRVIVLEDDLIVAPDFLGFLNAGLDRYKEDERVMQVSAYMYPGRFASDTDAVFLPIVSCWGWATWKRAWDQYDPTASGYSRLQTDKELRKRFNLGGAYDYYRMLEQQIEGYIDSWAVRWLLSVVLADGIVLYPPFSLVENIGVDGSGTHGSGSSALHPKLVPGRRLPANLGFPKRLEVDQHAVAEVQHILRHLEPGILRRIVRKLFR
jgi:GNT-I family protein